MTNLRVIVSLVALAALLVALTVLGRLQRGGPPHFDLVLGGNVPATFYLPGERGAEFGPPAPPPPGERPPAIVLAHGFSSDRDGMSALARSLAVAGYAVLAIDFRGHGRNRSSFTSARDGDRDFLDADLESAVAFLRTSPNVDGSRIVLMGHSMGAGASLAYGTRDAALDGLVLISGGWAMNGPHRPANALFIYADGDPAGIRDGSAALASQLAGVQSAVPGRIYGDFARGTAVSHFEVSGKNHVNVVAADEAVARIVGWLDGIFDVDRQAAVSLVDPRLRVAQLGLIAFLLVLPGLGWLLGRLAPVLDERAADGRAVGLGLLAGALLLTMPLLAVGNPAAFLALEVSELTTAHLGLTGIVLLAGLVAAGRLAPPKLLEGWQANLLVALFAMIAIYALLAPLGVVFHNLEPTPERAFRAVLVALVVLPFNLSLHWLLRRGELLPSILWSLFGRMLVGASLFAGVVSGIFPGVIGLVIPILIALFLLFEVLAASIYATSRNVVLIALIESAWLAWILAATAPIKVS